MITLDRFKKLMRIAVPIMGGMLSANLLTLVDTAMVGSLGAEAMAAAGVVGFAIAIIYATISGLSAAVQAITARRAGEKRVHEMLAPVHGGLLIAVVIGISIALILYPLAPVLFPYLTGDPEVIRVGVPYLRVMILGFLGFSVNCALMGYWNGIGKTKTYTYINIGSHVANGVLNYVFIFGKLGAPALGVLGAGLASVISIYLVTLGFLTLLFVQRPAGLFSVLPSRVLFRNLLSIMVPTAFRSIFQQGGYLVFTVMMGRIGTVELAATSILVRIMLVTIMPAFGLGMAGATMVGQSLGRGQPDEAATWGWDTVKVGAVVLSVMGLPLILFPETVLHIFITDPETVRAARVPVMLLGLSRPFSVLFILVSLLTAAGDAKRPTYLQAGLHWLLILPLIWLVGLQLGMSFTVIWVIESVHQIVQALLLGMLWRGGHWKTIKI